MYYASIDIETTGLNPDTCQILEIGVVLDDFTTPLADLPKLTILMNFPGMYGEIEAMKMNMRIIEQICEYRRVLKRGGQLPTHLEDGSELFFLQPSMVSWKLRSWLGMNGWDLTRNLTVAGKNFASFDLRFLEGLPDWSDAIKLKHRTLDPGSMYYLPEDGESPPNLELCLKRAGIARSGGVRHRAVSDALDVVQCIRRRFYN